MEPRARGRPIRLPRREVLLDQDFSAVEPAVVRAVAGIWRFPAFQGVQTVPGIEPIERKRWARRSRRQQKKELEGCASWRDLLILPIVLPPGYSRAASNHENTKVASPRPCPRDNQTQFAYRPPKL